MRAGPIGIFILKWLLVPLALLGVGYFVVGPRIGNTDLLPHTGPPQATTPSSSSDSVDDPEKPKRKGEPQVEVSVHRGSRFRAGEYSTSYDESGRKRTRRHRRRRSRSQGTTAPAPSNDQGGNDGGGSGGGGGDIGMLPGNNTKPA
jgi:hypothetical protein